jgi:hypothetical protein
MILAVHFGYVVMYVNPVLKSPTTARPVKYLLLQLRLERKISTLVVILGVV